MPEPDHAAVSVRCPKCGAAMANIGVLPQVGAHPELRTFRCGACRHVETQVLPFGLAAGGAQNPGPDRGRPSAAHPAPAKGGRL